MSAARYWLQKAKDERFGIGAFNVANLETFKAVAQAAANKRSPVIIESSPGETEFMWTENMVALANNYSKALKVPILVNLDHCTTFDGCQHAIDAGYDLIHYDGSKHSAEENLAVLKSVVSNAHNRGLTAEGELDHIGGSSEVHQEAASEMTEGIQKTDPERAAWFVRESGIDVFAAFVGNVHGLYMGGDKNIDVDLVKKIADSTGAFLSLHGSSGIPEAQVQEAIENGIVKINLNSEIRRVYKDTLYNILDREKNEYAMYKIMPEVITAVQELVEHKIDIFGSAGKV